MGNENSALTGQRPQWQLDDDATQCNSCSVGFTLFVRRHHCRQCGYIFCDRCCSRTVALPALGYMSPQRVCVPCLQKTIEAEPRAFQKLSPQSRRSFQQQRTKSGSFGQKEGPARHSLPQQLPAKTGPGSSSGSQGAAPQKSANVPLQLPGRPGNTAVPAGGGTVRREGSSTASSLAKPPVLTSTVSSRGSCISPQPERVRTPSTSNFSAPKAGTPLNLSLSLGPRGNLSFTSTGDLDLTGWDPNHVVAGSSPTSNSLSENPEAKTLTTRTRSLTETSHCSRESGAQASSTPQPTLESPTPVASSSFGDRRNTPRCPSEDELDKIYNKFLEKPHSTQTRKYMADSFNQFHVPLPDSLAKSGPF